MLQAEADAMEDVIDASLGVWIQGGFTLYEGGMQKEVSPNPRKWSQQKVESEEFIVSE